MGPLLDRTAWDDVLVTEARSPDGESLHLRIEPQDEPVESVPFGLAQLRPGATYVLDGAGAPITLAADDDGRAEVVVTVTGPTRLVLTPAGQP